MADVPVPSISTATQADGDTVLGVQGGGLRRFPAGPSFTQLAADTGASLVGFKQSGTGAVARTVQAKGSEVVSIEDFDSTAGSGGDDTAALLKALAALSNGGELRMQPKTYSIRRGNGSPASDNILADNITISGNGARIVSLNAAGALPNDFGNQHYNVFQATGRTGIAVKNIRFSGYCSPVAFYGCRDVVIEDIVDAAQLANAGNYMRDKSIFLDNCENVEIRNPTLRNFLFGVYLSGDANNRCRGIRVLGGRMEHTSTIGNYTASFPVGVYVHWADDVLIEGTTFKNIYSSLDYGDTGSGIGYGIYEGDGGCRSLQAVAPRMIFDAKGSKNAIGIFINESEQSIVSHPIFRVGSDARVVDCIRIDLSSSNSEHHVRAAVATYANAIAGQHRKMVNVNSDAATGGRVTLTDISCKGGSSAVYANIKRGDEIMVDGSRLSGQVDDSIRIVGQIGSPVIMPVVRNTSITKSGGSAIAFSCSITPVIENCELFDGNTAGTAIDGSCVSLSSYSFGLLANNNKIGNRAGHGGGFTSGIANVSNAEDRPLKDIVHNNTFFGISNNNRYLSYWTSSPTNGIADICKGDVIENSTCTDGQTPGWMCSQVLTPALTADASSASSTITVASTSSIGAGDIVLLMKSADFYGTGYYTAADFHVTTVQSVINGTQFVITNAIPAGDGTYVAGTAVVRIARFKALPAIAA